MIPATPDRVGLAKNEDSHARSTVLGAVLRAFAVRIMARQGARKNLSMTDSIRGCLLGTAVGDALGLPREGLSARRAAAMFPGPLRHRLLFGRGMISDDTEHAAMVGQALLASNGDADRFGRSLAWRLRGWLLGLPAGVGWATLRAIVKLWFGFGYRRSGVFSAGNGPAMRAPLIGACLGDTPRMREVLRVSTAITHTDEKAYEGALLVALAATGGRQEGFDPMAWLRSVRREVRGAQLVAALDLMGDHLDRGSTPQEFTAALGQAAGISGYVNHTVPAVLFCFLREPDDYGSALTRVVELGGDADTTGAILGGISGARLGPDAIDVSWRAGILEAPRSVAWLDRLGGRLGAVFQRGETGRPVRLAWPWLVLRNPVFLTVVLLHGFRRLLPPYGRRS